MSAMTFSAIPHPDYGNHPAYGKFFGFASLALRRQAIQRFWPQFRASLKQTQDVRKRQNAPRERSTPLYEQLIRDGVVALTIPDQVLTRLHPLIEPHVLTVQEKRAAFQPKDRKFEHTQVQLNTKPDRDPLLNELWKIFEDMGILDAAGLYLNKKIRRIGGAVQMNDSTDIHLKRHFADVGVDDPPTQYMHLDSTIDILKCILYYTPVTSETGPFGYVMGSNRHASSAIEYATRKASDLSRLDRCDAETRALFWALPFFFQNKAEFGNDLTDSKQMEALLSNERQFTSADGNLIFFDNNSGVHRGALITSGQRVIVQLLLGG